MVRKDVTRTDRLHPYFVGEDADHPHLAMLDNILVTYGVENPVIAYAQGMSDLLSPLLVTLDDEALAYWAFVRVMETQQAFFHHDQKGMGLQILLLSHLLQQTDPKLHQHFVDKEADSLIFCYRWLLVNFKREFGYADTLLLTEMLQVVPVELTRGELGGNPFVLFVALATLATVRQRILDWDLEHEEIILLVNDKAGKFDVPLILRKAKELFWRYTREEDAPPPPTTMAVPDGGEATDGASLESA